MFKKIYDVFCRENIVGKYIYANVAIYIIVAFIGVFATLFNAVSPVAEIVRWVELPASLQALLCRPWSIVTYMFVHEHMMHILLNMLALYAFGRIFLTFFSVRHFVGLYILGGIMGGIFFVLAFNLFPYFSNIVDGAHLIGASASVLAVIVASAVRRPNYTVNVMFLGSMRLMTVAVITVVLSLLLLASENAGGNFAHLGGAFAGWLFAFMLNKGKDITLWINKTIDFFATLFKRAPKKNKPKFTFHRGGRAADYEYNANKRKNEDEIDRILEKVKSGGYSSLSEEEKKRLFDASRP
ncbi:MAG: rhomboid family intramembrane serine protease [Bacteroidaceae bacterium]|nr:rhomboid family intramembrane serine protease [Bacteroidaceae bacterium]